jgi:hypothetical protein
MSKDEMTAERLSVPDAINETFPLAPSQYQSPRTHANNRIQFSEKENSERRAPATAQSTTPRCETRV